MRQVYLTELLLDHLFKLGQILVPHRHCEVVIVGQRNQHHIDSVLRKELGPNLSPLCEYTN